MLNRATVDDMFRKHAGLIGEMDAIPFETVCMLFGRRAAEYVQKNGTPGRDWNQYGFGPDGIIFFYVSGIYKAATYSNVQEIKNPAQAAT